VEENTIEMRDMSELLAKELLVVLGNEMIRKLAKIRVRAMQEYQLNQGTSQGWKLEGIINAIDYVIAELSDVRMDN